MADITTLALRLSDSTRILQNLIHFAWLSFIYLIFSCTTMLIPHVPTKGPIRTDSLALKKWRTCFHVNIYDVIKCHALARKQFIASYSTTNNNQRRHTCEYCAMMLLACLHGFTCSRSRICSRVS